MLGDDNIVSERARNYWREFNKRYGLGDYKPTRNSDEPPPEKLTRSLKASPRKGVGGRIRAKAIRAGQHAERAITNETPSNREISPNGR